MIDVNPTTPSSAPATGPTSDQAAGVPRAERGAEVVLADVSVRRGSRVALVVDALTVAPGVTCVIGPNGSGKSTLLDLIAGLLTADAGTVTVAGERQPRPRDVAYVLQSQHASAHVPVTAREVVALGLAPEVGAFRRLRGTHARRVAAALDRVEATDLANRHLGEMSGGQRQRVLVAQGLVQDAPILLLDEPVAGLDAASIATIRRVIASERDAGRTVVVATHDLAEAANADQVVLLAGHVVAAGPPASVLTAANLRAAYHGRLLDINGITFALDDGAHHDH